MLSPLRICVLQCCYDESDSVFKDIDPYCTPEVYDRDHKYQWRHAYIKKNSAVRQVRELAQSEEVDVFLNLCDGAFDEDRAGIEVVEALERYGCAYTGADRTFYEPTKIRQKKLCYYFDVPTSPWAEIMTVDMTDDTRALQQCERAVQGLRFPLIVKHFNGGGSIGMGPDCRVTDVPSLVKQVRKFVSMGGALVEEFIEGREFTVLVVENESDRDHPVALTPVECIFGPGATFKHFDLKWHDYESMRWQAMDKLAEPELCDALKRHAANAFVALKGCSYGRADFRVDKQGNVFFLEHNPNCGIFYPPDAMGSADYILSLDPQVNHAQFIDQIIKAALARKAKAQDANKTQVLYQQSRGFGLYAARDLLPGEVVVRFEETPHVLVSASYIHKVFGDRAVTRHPTNLAEHGARPPNPTAPTPAAPTRNRLSLLSPPTVTAGINTSKHKCPTSDPISALCDAANLACGDQCSTASTGRHGSSTPVSDSTAPDTTLSDLDLAQSVVSSNDCEAEAAGGGQHYTLGLDVVESGSDTDTEAQPTQTPATPASPSPSSVMAHPLPDGHVSNLRCLGWFNSYAYPITDETWVTWSEDPDQWLPLNHSCDPNVWLEGLDLVARRHIKEGEQVTADYATFTAHNLQPFSCQCGSAQCRKTVGGTDYLAPWLEQVYGDHISDYVRSKRQQLRQQSGVCH